MSIDIADKYRYLNAGAYTNIVRILRHGRLKNTGKFVILDTDFVLNNPLISSFGDDECKYDVDYCYKIANDVGFSAIMGSIGILERISFKHPGEMPLILRLNSGNLLNPEKVALTRPLTATIKDALHVGACAVCFSVYVSSEHSYEMLEDLREVLCEAHDNALPVIVEILPRGGFLSRLGEGSLDIIALAVRMICEMGADIIKAPYPHESIENQKAKKDYEDSKLNVGDSLVRLNHVVSAAFSGERLIGIGLTEFDKEKTTEEIKSLSQSNVHGLFISSMAVQSERTAEAVLLFDKGIVSSEMPLFSE